jgi:flavorubredoxin
MSKRIELAPGIYWVGVVDWDLRYFHGYVTQRGSSYNAYLIVDEKIALIDTVKAPFAESLLRKISQIIDPDKVDYLVSLHVEMDHAGSIPYMMQHLPHAKLVTSAPAGIKGLEAHFGPLKAQTVKSGDVLSLGQHSLHFLQTPMLHWPDNTAAFMPEEGILFSSDAFGQHYASTARFDDEVPEEKLFFEAAKYYANIVLPYGGQTAKALAAVGPLNPKILAPAHGIIWRSKIPQIVAKYADWAVQKTTDKAVVVYDTMWNSTAKMAEAITEGFEAAGLPVQRMALQQNHISDIIVELLEAKYIAVGSSTLNNNMLPTVASFLTYMKGLAVKARTGIAFGSYGWSGQSADQIQAILQGLGWQLPLEPQKQVYVPSRSDLDALAASAKNLVK